MAELTREQRIDRLQRIEALHANEGNAYAQKEEEVPENSQALLDMAQKGYQGANKGLSYLNDMKRLLVGHLTGSLKDGETAESLTSLKGAPSLGAQWERKGMPNQHILPEAVRDLMAGPGKAADVSNLLPVPIKTMLKAIQPAKEGAFDPKVSDVMDVADNATDPLLLASLGKTAASKGADLLGAKLAAQGTMNDSMRAKVGRMLEAMASRPGSAIGAPTKNLVQAMADTGYRRALRPLDEVSVMSKKGLFSPRLMEDGAIGGAGSIEQHIAEKSDQLGEVARGKAARLDELDPLVTHNEGYTPHTTGGVDMNAAMAPAEASMKGMDRSTKTVGDMKQALQEEIDYMKAHGRLSREEALKANSDLYSAVPDSTWDMTTRTPRGARARTAMAGGIKTQASRVAPSAGAEAQALAPTLSQATEEWGHYLTPREEAAKMAGKEAQRSWLPVTPKEAAMGFGVGALADASTGGAAVAAKKAFDAARSTAFGTTAGWLGNRYATGMGGVPSSLVDAYIRNNLYLPAVQEQPK